MTTVIIVNELDQMLPWEQVNDFIFCGEVMMDINKYDSLISCFE